MTVRKVSIFGATGSIGQNTLDLIRRDRSAYEIVALTGGKNISQLASDAIEFDAEIAVTCEPERYEELCERLEGTGVAVAAGSDALIEAADRPADWVMSAIVGIAGFHPSLHALKHGATLALANKESLVAGGALLMQTARRHGATILPVDSEHSAIFQALVGENPEAVEKIVITASGGAFRNWPIEKLAQASVADASTHPNWDMGQRITIDSASMFNKALEVIETREYFGVSPDQIEVLVHPQSLVHALVGYRDGGMMAHLGAPDMRHPIGFALNWPDRQELPVSRLDLAKVGQLDFYEPDLQRYPAIALARQVMDEGGLAGAVFNAAKERALDYFISGQIRFTDMARLVATTLDRAVAQSGLIRSEMNLETIGRADQYARAIVDTLVSDPRQKQAG